MPTKSPSSEPTANVGTPPAAQTGALVTVQGRTSIAVAVVQKIAGIATREVNGVHNLGGSTARALGSLRERIPGSTGPSVAQGVTVEVGETQAAIDLDIVVEYGVSIAELAKAVRRNVITTVERMTGLQVIEVNVSVDDIFILGGEPENAPSRVQ